MGILDSLSAYTPVDSCRSSKPPHWPLFCRAEGVIPEVAVTEDEFNFGAVYIGNRTKLPLSLVNLKPVPAIVTVDLRATPELQLLLPKDAWSSKVSWC